MITAASDAELLRQAQAGDATGLGVLLARHQASMRAVALSLLGFGPDTDDVMQDAALIALRRIGDVRDPEAVGPWLRAVVRNVCRTQLRDRSPIPLADMETVAPPAAGLNPEQLLEQHALRDWIWHAMEKLPADVRLTAMLRYFTDVSAYDEIAGLCDVPVSTVRSRLARARDSLGNVLIGTAEAAHDDISTLTDARRQEGQQIMAAAQAGAFADALAAGWSHQLDVLWPRNKRTKGFDYLVGAMERDLTAGVRQRLDSVVASRDVTIWEASVANPSDDPFHCPPRVVWVHFLEGDDGPVGRLRIYHPRKVGSKPAMC